MSTHSLLISLGLVIVLWAAVYAALRALEQKAFQKFEPTLPNPKGARKLRKSRAKASKKRKKL